jgi:hypothetical protein
MDAIFAKVVSGTLYGAFMGAGLGTFSGILSMYRKPLPTTLQFQHPVTDKLVLLDAFGLDEGEDVVSLLRRVHHAMEADPSIRTVAKRQFVVILARVRSFYNLLKACVDFPHNIQYKLKARRAATVAAQSIRNFESYIWDSQEIEDIMNLFAIVQKSMIDKVLFLEK